MTDTGGFRRKIFNSVKLSSLTFISEVGLRLISTVVLTRLLNPEIYGVFAVVLVYLYMLEMFSDIGIRPLILTKEGEVEDSFLRTVWTVGILRGVAIVIFSVIIALIVATLQARGVFAPDSPYFAEVLPWAFVALGGASLIKSFQSPMMVMSERNMDFGRFTVVFITSNVVALIVTIGLAYYTRSIWALVLGNVTRSTVLMVLSFLVFKGTKMRLHLNRKDLGLIIDRGKWIIGNSILTAFSQSADRLLLGFVMTSTAFGFYSIARQLAEIVYKFLMSLDAKMGLQVFGHLHKSSAEDFRRNYYKYRFFFDAISGLSAGGLVVLAPLVIGIIFDDRYQGVAPMVQILAVGILLTGPLLLRSAIYAQRRLKEMTYLNIGSTLTLWIGLIVSVFVFDSIPAALCVVAGYRLPEAIALVIMGAKRGWITLWREFMSVPFVIAGALIGWGILSLAQLGS